MSRLEATRTLGAALIGGALGGLVAISFGVWGLAIEGAFIAGMLVGAALAWSR